MELVDSETLVTVAKNPISEIKHKRAGTFRYTDVRLKTISSKINVKTLVSRFENCSTMINDNFDFAKQIRPKLDSISSLAESPSKKLKLSDSSQAASSSTPPSASSLRRSLARSSRGSSPWWRARGSPASSPSPSTRTRTPLPILVAANCPQNPCISSRGTGMLGRPDTRRPESLSRPERSSSSPPKDENTLCKASTKLSVDLATNASQQTAAQVRHPHQDGRDHLPAGTQQASLPLGIQGWHRALETEQSFSSEPAAGSPPPPSPATRRRSLPTLTRKKLISSSSPEKTERSTIKRASPSSFQAYLQRPEYPGQPGTKVHLTRCAPSRRSSSSILTGLNTLPGKQKLIFTFMGSIRTGEEDPPIIPEADIASSFLARGFVNCTHAGANSVRWGGKTTDQVERNCASQSEEMESSGQALGLITIIPSSPRGPDHPHNTPWASQAHSTSTEEVDK